MKRITIKCSVNQGGRGGEPDCAFRHAGSKKAPAGALILFLMDAVASAVEQGAASAVVAD
ncbi:hypothetical protein TUM12151_18120 [Morganella morganii]|nr:hypothetical protein TUM12149_17680 [Morganella morganii]GIZ30676.1 hypothetical protein TUM12150_11620 [Morganella morganii]GIZ34826.1 hypothetical protein TUM12151_18120 [Morganella morganii]